MAAVFKTNKCRAQSKNCSVVNCLRKASVLSLSLSLLCLVVSYWLRKSGFISAIWSNEVTTPKKEPVARAWSVYDWWTGRETEQEPTSLREAYPRLYRSAQTLDYLADCFFSGVDVVGVAVWNGVKRGCDFCTKKLPHLTTLDTGTIIQTWTDLGVAWRLGSLLCVVCLMGYLCLKWHRKRTKSVEGSTDLRQTGGHKASRQRPRVPVKRSVFIVVGVLFLVSIPWEFLRIYQTQVAKQAAITLKGAPAECYPHRVATLWQSVKAWCAWQLSWTYEDPCVRYHEAVLVDPVWEVTPMLVLSSLVSRCITTPLQVSAAAVGSSLRLLLREIPAPWQPVILILIAVMTLTVLLLGCRYRVLMPLFLRIEPHKTPVVVRSCQHKLSHHRHGNSLDEAFNHGYSPDGSVVLAESTDVSLLSQDQSLVSEWDF